jgi:transporter family-2 protein
MTALWPMLAAALIGLAISQQPAINGATAGALGSAFAAAGFSLTISALLVIAMTWVRGTPPSLGQLAALPWWAVLGGVAGAIFVAGGAMLVPLAGAAVFFTCVIAGQLLGAVVADAVGAWGLEERAVSPRKLIGVALAFGGVVLVRWG